MIWQTPETERTAGFDLPCMVRRVDVDGKAIANLIGGNDFVACHLWQWKREESSSQISRADAADEATDEPVSAAEGEMVGAVAEHGPSIFFVTVESKTYRLKGAL